ncbi:mannose-1-phosphate guanylyltransferase/mannose-1-phosphate guanylyltransferase / mannose-6-phosphate isomerase [Noviherbaspirillum humi]|uniref:mannose-1-phosphate guanylyltransferase n=1 Tax=Noviherbaspirillum humi TaxID=1688639 RepID=A0A239CTL0_9BURK|nr:mannose-1-phosphate guanylyltransferase/mannose-6-phosphate isomerase [Noviherbaspirillum humi]SNS23417.1 mannose-1-phosphate guanylyltransferase/mannose-1-phosphate guanylyltransferase / mannose-6-phosphate isomerase [Noviherbaspirillum humi]
MLTPIILSGGAGTRLWPVSREAHPKPFMRIGGGKCLLLQTFERAQAVAPQRSPLIVTNREYHLRSRDELPAKGTLPHYLLEPAGRNTAPAIALAALWAQQEDPDACLLVMPADHLITNVAAFRDAAVQAEALARDGFLVLFGIRPTAPETGYGYVEMGDPVRQQAQAHAVKAFHEKPDAATAAGYLAQGNFVWNSGIFCFRADVILQALETWQPPLMQAARSVWEAAGTSGDKTELPEAFEQLDNISIDYAVMEKAQNIAVVPGDFGWSDMGAWSAVADTVPADADGNNTNRPDAILIDTRHTYIDSKDRLVAAIGLDNILIVDTPDALLVADRAKSQEVKQVVSQLKARNHEAHKIHRTAVRPWGTYTVLGEGQGFKIKRVVVKPGHSLSLQMHHHRSEHWVVVFGTASITVGETTRLMTQNQSTYIAIGERHRLANPGITDLVLIEVQCGSYLGEDDIVRFSDVYGRA